MLEHKNTCDPQKGFTFLFQTMNKHYMSEQMPRKLKYFMAKYRNILLSHPSN